jgi:hypothetical protein
VKVTLLDGNDGVERVFLGPQQQLEFPIPEGFRQLGEIAGHFLEGLVVFLFHRQV